MLSALASMRHARGHAKALRPASLFARNNIPTGQCLIRASKKARRLEQARDEAVELLKHLESVRSK